MRKQNLTQVASGLRSTQNSQDANGMAAMKPEHLPSLWGTVYMHKEVLTTLFCKVIKLENTQVFTFLAGHMAHVCNPNTGRPKREGCEFKIYKRRLSRVHAH